MLFLRNSQVGRFCSFCAIMAQDEASVLAGGGPAFTELVRDIIGQLNCSTTQSARDDKVIMCLSEKKTTMKRSIFRVYRESHLSL